MIVSCRRCDRPLRIRFLSWWGQSVWFCPPKDESGCFATYKALFEDPPEEEPDHPDSLPPHDIDDCHVCGGSGSIFKRQDWQTGAYITDDCTWCATTGREPGR